TFARNSALLSALLALCLGAGNANAQAMAVPYANSNWLLGLGSPGFDGGDTTARSNMPSGWFVANTQGSLGGFNRFNAFGNFSSL
ncbi:hypothetical protein ABTE50_19040, partial [Acinetobacter baumannii]